MTMALQLVILLHLIPQRHCKVLTPGLSIDNEIIYPNQPVMYDVQDLIPSHQYEVRISYPASIPTYFTIRVDDGKTNPDHRRLNTEKLIIDGIVTRIYVYAEPEGIAPLIDLKLRPTPYNIVVEELLYGVPISAFRLVFAIITLLGIGWKFVVPWLDRFVVKVQAVKLK